jgi:hypothetical protein
MEKISGISPEIIHSPRAAHITVVRERGEMLDAGA